jgi:hypothetical protein
VFSDTVAFKQQAEEASMPITHYTQEGIVRVPFMDAEDGTPILDIKPYHPSVDRIREVRVPAWCATWPQWYEDSATFDWGGAVFGSAQQRRSGRTGSQISTTCWSGSAAARPMGKRSNESRSSGSWPLSGSHPPTMEYQAPG